MVADINLKNLQSYQGFSILGGSSYDYSGSSVAGIGDINKDGKYDFAIGAPGANFDSGITYVIYGTTSFNNKIDLSSLPASAGFKIIGLWEVNANEYPIAALGDINGDGIDDFAIANPNGDLGKGVTNVIYGKEGIFSNINLYSATSNNFLSTGFTITGNANSLSGSSIAGLGDINGDGIDDFAISAPGTGEISDGITYVIYGKSNSFTYHISLSSFFTSTGFKIKGGAKAVFALNDINDDGINDFAISIPGGNPNGITYVIYGRSENFNDFDLSSLTPSGGFKIIGPNPNYYNDAYVAEVGDINGDGIKDFAISVSSAESGISGVAYVIYGKSGTFNDIDLSLFSPSVGFKITSAKTNEFDDHSIRCITKIGDINNDNKDDFMVTAPLATSNGLLYAGISYILFGKTNFSDINLANFTSLDGFTINGASANDGSGLAVGVIGDINGDGGIDIIIGAPNGDASISKKNAGISYVLYTKDIANFLALSPTITPTIKTTIAPTFFPSQTPTKSPTIDPTFKPTLSPIVSFQVPTLMPSYIPSNAPTEIPTVIPTFMPTAIPSIAPTAEPTAKTSLIPSMASTINPTQEPSIFPTFNPSTEPTIQPTFASTEVPTLVPTKIPYAAPTLNPTIIPSITPTFMPTEAIYITNGGTYNGSSNSENFIIDSSEDTVITGGGGSDMYSLKPHANVTLTITDFNVNFDIINLQSLNIRNFNELNITAGSIIINLEENQKIRLLNLTPGDIGANNFIFDSDPSFAPSLPPLYNEDNQAEQNSDSGLVIGIAAAAAVAGVTLLGTVGCCLYSRFCGVSSKVYAADNNVELV